MRTSLPSSMFTEIHQLLEVGHGGHTYTAPAVRLYKSGSWSLAIYQHTTEHSERGETGDLECSRCPTRRAGHVARRPGVELSWGRSLFPFKQGCPLCSGRCMLKPCPLGEWRWWWHLLLIYTKAANRGAAASNLAHHRNHLRIFKKYRY